MLDAYLELETETFTVNRLLFDEIPPEQLIDNSGLESRHLNGNRLHLNTAGSARLASNFRTHIRQQSL